MPDIPSYDIDDEYYDDFEDYELGTYDELAGGYWKKFEEFALVANEVEIYGTLSWRELQEKLHGFNYNL